MTHTLPPKEIYDVLHEFESLGGKVPKIVDDWWHRETMINEGAEKLTRAPNALKVELLQYYQGLECVCGAKKVSGFWECFKCFHLTDQWPQKMRVRRGCDMHTFAAEEYLLSLKAYHQKSG